MTRSGEASRFRQAPEYRGNQRSRRGGEAAAATTRRATEAIGRTFATRLARYYARNPVALERLTYDRAAAAVTYRSNKSEGPTTGTETLGPVEFSARVLVHVPDKGHVTTRYAAREIRQDGRRQSSPNRVSSADGPNNAGTVASSSRR